MTINGSKIIAADNVASNGMLPGKLETLQSRPLFTLPLSKTHFHHDDTENLSLFAAAIQRAGLTAAIEPGKLIRF